MAEGVARDLAKSRLQKPVEGHRDRGRELARGREAIEDGDDLRPGERRDGDALEHRARGDGATPVQVDQHPVRPLGRHRRRDDPDGHAAMTHPRCGRGRAPAPSRSAGAAPRCPPRAPTRPPVARKACACGLIVVGTGTTRVMRAVPSAARVDPIGRFNFEGIRPRHIRLRMALEGWEPENDDDNPGRARRGASGTRGTTTVPSCWRRRRPRGGSSSTASIWDVPAWMVTNPGSERNRKIPPELYPELPSRWGSGCGPHATCTERRSRTCPSTRPTSG